MNGCFIIFLIIFLIILLLLAIYKCITKKHYTFSLYPYKQEGGIPLIHTANTHGTCYSESHFYDVLETQDYVFEAFTQYIHHFLPPCIATYNPQQKDYNNLQSMKHIINFHTIDIKTLKDLFMESPKNTFVTQLYNYYNIRGINGSVIDETDRYPIIMGYFAQLLHFAMLFRSRSFTDNLIVREHVASSYAHFTSYCLIVLSMFYNMLMCNRNVTETVVGERPIETPESYQIKIHETGKPIIKQNITDTPCEYNYLKYQLYEFLELDNAGYPIYTKTNTNLKINNMTINSRYSPFNRILFRNTEKGGIKEVPKDFIDKNFSTDPSSSLLSIKFLHPFTRNNIAVLYQIDGVMKFGPSQKLLDELTVAPTLGLKMNIPTPGKILITSMETHPVYSEHHKLNPLPTDRHYRFGDTIYISYIVIKDDKVVPESLGYEITGESHAQMKETLLINPAVKNLYINVRITKISIQTDEELLAMVRELVPVSDLIYPNSNKEVKLYDVQHSLKENEFENFKYYSRNCFLCDNKYLLVLTNSILYSENHAWYYSTLDNIIADNKRIFTFPIEALLDVEKWKKYIRVKISIPPGTTIAQPLPEHTNEHTQFNTILRYDTKYDVLCDTSLLNAPISAEHHFQSFEITPEEREMLIRLGINIIDAKDIDVNYDMSLPNGEYYEQMLRMAPISVFIMKKKIEDADKRFREILSTPIVLDDKLFSYELFIRTDAEYPNLADSEKRVLSVRQALEHLANKQAFSFARCYIRRLYKGLFEKLSAIQNTDKKRKFVRHSVQVPWQIKDLQDIAASVIDNDELKEYWGIEDLYDEFIDRSDGRDEHLELNNYAPKYIIAKHTKKWGVEKDSDNEKLLDDINSYINKYLSNVKIDTTAFRNRLIEADYHEEATSPEIVAYGERVLQQITSGGNIDLYETVHLNPGEGQRIINE